MMINCKKAAELTCQAKDRRLMLGERLRLRFHVLMCGACRAFQRECEEFERLFTMRFASNTEREDIRQRLDRLPDDVCERLKQRLRAALEQRPLK